MHRLMWVYAAVLATSPVAARELDSSDTKKARSYTAFQTDKTGGVELQFFCDHNYPGDIQMLVFTDVDAEEGDKERPSSAVSIVVNGTSFDDLNGYYDAVEGERIVVVDTLEESRLRQVLATARGATQPLQILYDGRSQRFGIDGIVETLDSFVGGCERS
ncbi:hypothetical protein N8D56_27120 (plasmid) [Devosia sp. A8/3-2]|nr:hypothetical protein N8D56_27120 [Devosia sp. A8/3-2]